MATNVPIPTLNKGGITTVVWRKLAVFMVMACALPLAHAEFFGFGCITSNNPINCTTGAGQLFGQVTDGPNTGQVTFQFFNIGSQNSSITDIYFDNGTLLGIASVVNGLGTDFSQLATPGNLPSANSADPDFETTEGFSADSNPEVQPNGVNPGETMSIIFNLINSSLDLQDTLAALGDGSLRIGLHVQGFAEGGSESFINGPGGVVDPRVTTVPEPSSVILLGTTLLGVCHFLRKRFAA